MFDLLCTQTDGIYCTVHPISSRKPYKWVNCLVKIDLILLWWIDKNISRQFFPPWFKLPPLSCKQSSIFFWNTWFNRGNNNPWWCCLIYWLEFEFFSVGMRVMLIANVCHQQSILKEGCWHQSCLQTTRAPRTPSAQPWSQWVWGSCWDPELGFLKNGGLMGWKKIRKLWWLLRAK